MPIFKTVVDMWLTVNELLKVWLQFFFKKNNVLKARLEQDFFLKKRMLKKQNTKQLELLFLYIISVSGKCLMTPYE